MECCCVCVLGRGNDVLRLARFIGSSAMLCSQVYHKLMYERSRLKICINVLIIKKKGKRQLESLKLAFHNSVV